ncbi:MAG: hypothetical protein H0A75_00215 [Candidatus Methanofishera endochildressiae]|uniref:Uncharacterized protein n=1 Tax=Candidatus Methanofishera endochildressiae TaxID=2738884 RepID=A0A7Z0MNB4_9GAMM|nr:hypothetical protein [Candidatus Methanofishera endochildressiae]
MDASRPISVVNEFVGRFWAKQINVIIAATLSGMTDISEITLGTGSQDFSGKKMVDDSRLKKGGHEGMAS